MKLVGRNRKLAEFHPARKPSACVNAGEDWQTVKMVGIKSVLYMINILDMSGSFLCVKCAIWCGERDRERERERETKKKVSHRWKKFMSRFEVEWKKSLRSFRCLFFRGTF